MLVTVYLFCGIVLLYFGADFLVKGSSRLALRFGVSSLVVGLTVVAFGTSAPELVVSITSGLRGLGDLALGNVIGSNIFNIAVILGISAMIRPLKVHVQILRIDTPIMVAVSLLLVFFLRDKTISRLEGVFLVVGILMYTMLTIYFVKKNPQSPGNPEPSLPNLKGTLVLDIFFITGGLGALIAGSQLFVKGAVALAQLLHFSEAVISLTIVAAGTSLPELATSVVAAIKKEEDIAIGNIVGSNIFNILLITGLTGTLTPLHAFGIGTVDLMVMVATAVLLLPLMRTGFRLNRVEGAILFMIYGGYLLYLWPR